MEKIFITGSNGFIGSNLCKYFLEKGFEVYGLVRESSDLHFLEGLDVRLIYGDLKNPESIEIPHDIDYIVHSASIVSDLADESQCYSDIYLLALNLIQKILEVNSNLKRVVYISTALTLGFNSINISEEKPGRSADFLPYTQYKKKTEEYFLDQFKKNGLPVVILRPADVYGPNDRTSSALMLKACDKRVPLIVGHGNWYFGFCYIDNLSQAIYLACIKSGIEGRSYTVTNNKLLTWRELFSEFQKGLNKKQSFYVPVSFAFAVGAVSQWMKKIFPRFDPSFTTYRIKRITSHTTYDISKTIRELGYEPDNNTEKQIQEIISWYLKEKEKGLLDRY